MDNGVLVTFLMTAQRHGVRQILAVGMMSPVVELEATEIVLRSDAWEGHMKY
jgi:hypothetical protein